MYSRFLAPGSPSAKRRFDWRREDAAQLVEFAVSLPLLVVFVVGIFDFSGAFTLKQKLTNVARDAARVAAADPITDLGMTSGIPLSVSDAFYVIHNYMLANNINDCGLKVTDGALTLIRETWQFSAGSPGSPCGIIITINRGYYFPLPVTSTPPPLTCRPVPPAGGGQTQIVGTCITIQYSYPWRFGQAASLLGRNTPLPSMITAQAVVPNEN